MLNIKVWMWSLGLWSTTTFLLCVLWGLVAPEGLHMSELLEAVLPGFRWLTGTGFIIGLVESYLYGAYAGVLFVFLHNRLYRRWQG